MALYEIWTDQKSIISAMVAVLKIFKWSNHEYGFITLKYWRIIFYGRKTSEW